VRVMGPHQQPALLADLCRVGVDVAAAHSTWWGRARAWPATRGCG
jgi:hypothetical protein